jgi:hypothetical protein
MNEKNQFLGRHPNGSFFIIKDTQKIAQSVADEDGFQYFEFSEKSGKISLAEITPEAGASAPPPDVEIKTVVVNGIAVNVSTLTPEAKKVAKEKAAAEIKARHEKFVTARNKKRIDAADASNAAETAAVEKADEDKRQIREGEKKAVEESNAALKAARKKK